MLVNTYEFVLNSLKNMDDAQLQELFHDLPIAEVEKIYNSIKKYIEN